MKRPLKQNKLEQIDKKLQELQKRRAQAYMSGMSQDIIRQLDQYIDEASLEMYTESELAKHRATDKGDGEDYIV